MNVDFLKTAYEISHELGRFVEEIAMAEFHFGDIHPVEDGRANKQYLWLPEYLALRERRIDLRFRCRMLEYILGVWRQRLKGYQPYRHSGYAIYLYDMSSPRLSVCANWDPCFPRRDGDPSRKMIATLEEFFRKWADEPWRGNCCCPPREEVDGLLRAIEKGKGSIATGVAQSLGMNGAALRRLIEDHGLGEEVNRIRKMHKRRPVRFRKFWFSARGSERLFLLILPPNYD
jgi:hypothetical protein